MAGGARLKNHASRTPVPGSTQVREVRAPARAAMGARGGGGVAVRAAVGALVTRCEEDGEAPECRGLELGVARVHVGHARLLLLVVAVYEGARATAGGASE